MSTYSEDDIVKIQLDINQRLYSEIADCYSIATTDLDYSTAVGVIISAIATNLGSILAQIPDQHRETYLNISKEIIDMSFSAALEDVLMNKWGAVGHA